MRITNRRRVDESHSSLVNLFSFVSNARNGCGLATRRLGGHVTRCGAESRGRAMPCRPPISDDDDGGRGGVRTRCRRPPIRRRRSSDGCRWSSGTGRRGSGARWRRGVGARLGGAVRAWRRRRWTWWGWASRALSSRSWTASTMHLHTHTPLPHCTTKRYGYVDTSLKPSFSANPSHCSLSFSSSALTT